MMNDLTVLVNTSDGFEDCWIPFFSLFHTYWRDCPYPVVLNTEHKAFAFPGVDIVCAKVAEATGAQKLSWSDCLARCLDRIPSPLILYLQEDYFLEAPVRGGVLEALAGEVTAGRADVVRLMECGGAGPWHPSAEPWLWEVDRRARYRISLQAAIWRKDVLRSHLRSHESAWQLEVFGSARARRLRGERVMCANRDLFHGPGREVIPYTPTGVVKGQWDRDIVCDLFQRHGIEVDFSIRGFHDRAIRHSARPRLMRRLTDRMRSLV